MHEKSMIFIRDGRTSRYAWSWKMIDVNDIITGTHMIALMVPNKIGWMSFSRRSMRESRVEPVFCRFVLMTTNLIICMVL